MLAWYTAVNGNLSKGTQVDSSRLTASNATVGLADAAVVVTVSEQDPAVSIRLTDKTTGEQSKAYVVSAGKAVADTGSDPLYTYADITVNWDSTPDDPSLYNGATTTVTLTGQGNVELLGTSDPTDAHDERVEPSVTITVSVVAGALSLSSDKVYYAIRTNNENGAEVLAEKTWAATTAFAVGDMVKQSDNYYVCKKGHTSSAAFNTDSANWQDLGTNKPALHSADIIHVA